MLIKKENLGKVSVTVEKDYWLQDKCYDRLVIVQQEGGGTYISRKPVPSGKELTDRNYWIPIIEGSSSNNNSPAPNDNNTLKGRTAKGAYIDVHLLFSIESQLIDEMLPLIALQIDSIKDDIELDEITPKLLTERDDYGINITAFAMAYSVLNEDSGGSGGSRGSGSIKKNTKSSNSNSSTLFEHNAVVIKQDNDVLRCISQHEDLFIAYMFATQTLGDSQGNNDYPEQYSGVEPLGVHPYHDMSGIYVSDNGDMNFDDSSISRNVDAYNSLNNRSETKIKTSSTKHNVTIPTLEDFNDFKNNIKSKLITRFGTKTNTKKISNGEDDFDPEYPQIDSEEVTEVVNGLLNGYTPKTQVAINDFIVLELSDQTINIKKYMIGFYKIMKLIEYASALYDEDVEYFIEELVSSIIEDIRYNGFSDSLRSIYEGVILGAESNEEAIDLWNIISNYNQREGFMYITKERRQAIYKEITDAIYDFDVLLGNNMNIPYEDTISLFIKFQNVWYEIITPMPTMDVFEPNKEFKLVHLGDWKHVGLYNNQVLGYITSEFGDPDEPIDRDSSDYMGDGLNIVGPGGNSGPIVYSSSSKISNLK